MSLPVACPEVEAACVLEKGLDVVSGDEVFRVNAVSPIIILTPDVFPCGFSGSHHVFCLKGSTAGHSDSFIDETDALAAEQDPYQTLRTEQIQPRGK